MKNAGDEETSPGSSAVAGKFRTARPSPLPSGLAFVIYYMSFNGCMYPAKKTMVFDVLLVPIPSVPWPPPRPRLLS